MTTALAPTTAIINHYPAHPIAIEWWPCNGSVNPLLRTIGDLRAACKDDADYAEALRWCRIAVECHTHQPPPADPQALLTAAHAAHRPSWRTLPVLLDGARTTAQLLAKHGNLRCLARCVDAEDLAAACAMVGEYNAFDGAGVGLLLARRTPKAFYQPDNPNNCTDAIDWHFGWEGSSVIYARVGLRFPSRLLSDDARHWFEVDRAWWIGFMKLLGTRTRADESAEANDSDAQDLVWRFWWD